MSLAKRPIVEQTPQFTQIAKACASGKRGPVRWGIDDMWMPICEYLQPRLGEILAGMPPAALARMLYDAHVAIGTPDEKQRTFASLMVGFSPSSRFNATQQLMEMLDLYRERYGSEKMLTSKTPESHLSVVPKQVPQAQLPPPPQPQPEPEHKPKAKHADPADPLTPLLTMPVGQLLPLFKLMLTEALKELVTASLQPHLQELHARIDAIDPTVRSALVAVLGEPAPTAPVPAVALESPVAAEPLPGPPEPPQELILPFPPTTPAPVPQPPKDEGQVEDNYTRPFSQQASPPVGPSRRTQMLELPVVADDAPHDLADQMERAAKALGMPHVKRPSVVICGLHPRVFEDLEKKHGRVYRFVYVKQDHLTEASDLPASTDALLLHRKKLNSFVAGAVRRYAIPSRTIGNSVASAEWALREIFA